MKVLIAEDDPVSNRLLEGSLVSWGYDVVATGNGAAALEILQSADRPMLAILDVVMPEMTGIEVCRALRGRSPSIPPPYIILLTGINSKEDLVKGIEAGANDYLTKPFYRDELRVRVNVGTLTIDLQRKLSDRVTELEEALSQVKRLEGMLPICSYCRMIRDDQDRWQNIDMYIAQKTSIEFSHGICPTCYEVEWPSARR
ncbi:MAG: response regulator [Blastocatellia bacterium]|nr:response regulator [Blastocatellia bacterium]